MNDGIQWKGLDTAFEGAVSEYHRSCEARLQARDIEDAVTKPLYHYTDRNGLKGIVNNQQIWLTHYRYLNDTSELSFGMDIAREVLKEVGQEFGPKVQVFCDMVVNLFSLENLSNTIDVYVASFSRKSDDLNQWRSYGDNGRGFAFGFSPGLFAVDTPPGQEPHRNVFVAPVHYGKVSGRRHHRPAIESAARIVAETVETQAHLMRDRAKGLPFLDAMARSLIAGELLLNSLTLKHDAFESEEEVRLFILGESTKLAPYVSKRPRNGGAVPFIKTPMPIRQPGRITEILVGPSAPADAEEIARGLLRPFLRDRGNIVRRSRIPYRAS